jgi:hypothetical protein
MKPHEQKKDKTRAKKKEKTRAIKKLNQKKGEKKIKR